LDLPRTISKESNLSVSVFFAFLAGGGEEEILLGENYREILKNNEANYWQYAVRIDFLRRLKQEQVCLFTYFGCTPEPNKWPQGDSRY
jgi:hypothetical protein